MGNLIIRKVKYIGEQYFFESPELGYGINIIVGDNGSGKSTFAYFIEYGLGGNVKPFNDDKDGGKYREILEDTNNFVELSVLINDIEYTLKRFINHNDVFINDGKTVEKLPINRNKDYAPRIFSDWLLEKLNIPIFELNLGTNTWFFNFSDLFRLLCYDQDTEPRKIYKSPSNENYISDSSIIRKSTFEAILGISSIAYFKKLDELKNAQKLKDFAKSRLSDFLVSHPNRKEAIIDLEKKIEEMYLQLEKVTNERNLYQKQNTKVDEKTEHLASIQSELIETELKISEDTVKSQNFKNEVFKIDRLFSNLNQEILEIQKTIFTHEKLNLFSMEICPFCMNKKEKKEGFCICGGEFKKDDYEKFVYNSSEYREILRYKEKSIATISTALTSYNEEIRELEIYNQANTKKSTELKIKLRNIINAIEYSGNSQFIDTLNDKIMEIKSEIFYNENTLDLVKQQNILESDLENRNNQFKRINEEYQSLRLKFEQDNIKTIKEFNAIYNELMKRSSYKSIHAEIDEEYMPYIDEGMYKNKSADVPKRLMYYFTTLSLSLKLKSVKHPRFLLIDTPETVGIDDDNLKDNLELLDLALELSKNNEEEKLEKFQVILTTGENKYPDDYQKYIKLAFSEDKKEYILKRRELLSDNLSAS